MTHDERFAVRFERPLDVEHSAPRGAAETASHAYCDYERWVAWRHARCLDPVGLPEIAGRR